MAGLDLTHHFLIAMPQLADPNFQHTVTYICAHSAEGAMGIVINRPLDMPLGEVLAQMDLASEDGRVNAMAVYDGGPVQRDRGFVLYRPPYEYDSTLRVSDTVALATSRDILEAICRGEGPADTLVALGYAGWGAGQLEQEMVQNAWLTTPADEDILFRTPHDQRYARAVARMGVDLRDLSTDVGHA